MVKENNDRGWATVVTIIFCVGLAAQWAGVYALWGTGIALIISGSELAALGLVGATRRAR